MVNKNKFIVALGFGIGGALWGLEAYRGTVGSDEVFTNPFSYILGAVALAICGGIALGFVAQRQQGEKRLPKTIKIVGLGLVGWLVAFMVPAVWAYELWLFGSTVGIIPELFARGDTVDGFLSLKPSMGVAYFWIEFLISGLVLGLFYALILKTKILKVILYSSGGFALASLFGPILGNLAGDLFGSLFIIYLFTFLIIGIIFGFFLATAVFSRVSLPHP